MSQQPEEDEMQYHDDTGYKNPVKVSVEEVLKKDQDDESLTRWKAQLLSENVPKNDKNVVFENIVIKINEKEYKFTLQQASESNQNKSPLFTIQEKQTFQIGFAYNVYNQIVAGLHAVFKVSKLGIAIAKQNIMLGSFAPKPEQYQYFMEEIEAPSGPLGRGQYIVKCAFGDDDNKTGAYGTIEFYFKIDKQSDLM